MLKKIFLENQQSNRKYIQEYIVGKIIIKGEVQNEQKIYLYFIKKIIE
jgi:hypothetical protein